MLRADAPGLFRWRRLPREIQLMATLTHVMAPVAPGRCTVVTAADATMRTAVLARRLADEPVTLPSASDVSAPAPVWAGEAVVCPVLQVTGETLTVEIPEGLEGVLAMALDEAPGDGPHWLVNQPRIDWLSPCSPRAGEPFRVLGRCLSAMEPGVGPGQAEAPFGAAERGYGRLDQVASRAVLVNEATGAMTELNVERGSCWELFTRAPADLSAGDYALVIHHGRGGPAAWSERFALTVQPAAPTARVVLDADVFIAQAGDDIDAGLEAGLAAVAKAGGGVLRLSARRYALRRTIVMPAGVTLRGAGASRTLISLPESATPTPPYVAITGDGDFAVEDLRITARHCPLLICAPTFVPATYEEALGVEEATMGRRASNVAVRRCELKQELLGGAMRRRDQPQLDHLHGFLRRPQQHAHGWQGVVVRGDGVVVEDCDIQGGGTCVTMNRSTDVRVRRNRLRAGAGGQCLICYSHMDWPDPATLPANAGPEEAGAPIEGAYCHHLLVEENDCSAGCTTTRNLVNFMRGGAFIHVARNHIHDISSTTDGEALLFHLWFARWPETRIEMTGPTSGVIHDPTGEVARESLIGGAIEIVEGRGVGQLRRVVAREGDRFEIDRPWAADPDATSRPVFTAPPPFERIVITQNVIEKAPINLILWGNTHDVVVDGNHTGDGPGLTLWSVRFAGDQKVWGGCAFTLMCHNTMDRGYSTPQTRVEALDAGLGQFTRCSRAHDCTTLGYDVLGLVVRDNFATGNSGMAFRHTYPVRHPDGRIEPWRIHDAGVVYDHNAIVDSTVGVAIQTGARAIERATRAVNVRFPVVWVDPDGDLPNHD